MTRHGAIADTIAPRRAISARSPATRWRRCKRRRRRRRCSTSSISASAASPDRSAALPASERIVNGARLNRQPQKGHALGSNADGESRLARRAARRKEFECGKDVASWLAGARGGGRHGACRPAGSCQRSPTSRSRSARSPAPILAARVAEVDNDLDRRHRLLQARAGLRSRQPVAAAEPDAGADLARAISTKRCRRPRS